MEKIWRVIRLAAMLACLCTEKTLCQHLDSIRTEKAYKLGIKQAVIPVSFIAVGIVGLESDWLKYNNREIRDELMDDIDRRFSIDDFTQYALMLAVYGLNFYGIKGANSLKTYTVALASGALLMTASVNALKYTTSVERPDGSSKNSFPSGHTATAFMGAEFLWQEYKDVSPWIGVAGYAVAAGTGFFRMYNNRHWFTDVVAGAGIGMLSAKLAYYFRTCARKSYVSVEATPYYTSSSAGLCFRLSF